MSTGRLHVLTNPLTISSTNLGGGHSRSWAAGQVEPTQEEESEDAWENDFNFDALPVPVSVESPTTQIKVERLALNYRLVDVVSRAYQSINELADEELKVKEVCNQFKQHSINLDDCDLDESIAWMDSALGKLSECCLNGFNRSSQNAVSFVEEASELLNRPMPNTSQFYQLMTMLQIWLKVEKYCICPSNQKDPCFQNVSSSVSAAILQLKLLADGASERNSPLFALTVVILNEMHDQLTSHASPKKPLPKYPSDASMSSSRPNLQLEIIYVLRLAILSVVLHAFKLHRHSRALPWSIISHVSLCMAHLLMSSFEIPIAMDYACLTSKIAAYITQDDITLGESKSVLCQAQTSLKFLHDEEDDWAEFDEHERSQRLFSMQWSSNQAMALANADDCIVRKLPSHEIEVDSDSSDWDFDTKSPGSCVPNEDSGLQHPSASASSLSTILNMRELFVQSKDQKTSSWHIMLTQLIEHPPTDHIPMLPPPSSPYSRTFAAFENGNILNNSFRSTRSMDEWIRDLPWKEHQFSTFNLEVEMHHLANTTKFTTEWIERYVTCCRQLLPSDTDLCLNLVHNFFNTITVYTIDDIHVCETKWKLIVAGLELCLLVVELSYSSIDSYFSILQPLRVPAEPEDETIILQLYTNLLKIECKIHHALVSTDDFYESSARQSLWEHLSFISKQLHAFDGAEHHHHLCPSLQELSMLVVIYAHALWTGVSPVTLKCIHISSSTTNIADTDEAVILAKCVNVFQYFTESPVAKSAGASWQRLRHLYPLLSLNSYVRVRAGLLMGVCLWQDNQFHDAENIFYESIYVLHTHFTLHSLIGCNSLVFFGDALLSMNKYEFAMAAFDSAYQIAGMIHSVHFMIDLERRLAILCGEHDDIDRSIKFYQKIRARSMTQSMWFEYVYISVTVSTILMDKGDYSAAAHDIAHVLQHTELTASTAADILTELQVLSIRLNICYLKLHCPHRATSILEQCIQKYQPKASKHIVILMWLAIAYYKAGQMPHCELTLKSIAKLRKEYGMKPVVGSFSKLPPPFRFNLVVQESVTADLYPLHAQVALRINDFERAAHYSALSVIYVELQQSNGHGSHLAYLYYLRGKVLLAAASSTWLFPMKLQSLECEQLMSSKARIQHRRKSSALLRERVLVSIDECMYHSLRAFHHSYEQYKALDDRLGMMKAASRLSGVYLQKIFLPRMVLHRPFDQLLKFSLKRRLASSTNDVKASDTIEFEFSMDDIEQPAKLAWEMSLNTMAPRLYMEACLHLCQVYTLRERGSDALGYWYEARDVFLHSILCPSQRSMQRVLHRLIETLLILDSSIINDNIILLELYISEPSAEPLRDATYLKKTAHRKYAMAAETSLSYQSKLREKPAKAGHQRHKSDTLELLATRLPPNAHHQHNSSGPLKSPITPLRDHKVCPRQRQRSNVSTQKAIDTCIHDHFIMLKHNRDKNIDSEVKNRRVLREIWDLMESFRGSSIAMWLSSVGYDKETMDKTIYLVDLSLGAITVSYIPSSGKCEWKWIEFNQLTLASSSSLQFPFRRFQLDLTTLLPTLSAPMVPNLYSCASIGSNNVRDLQLFAHEFTQRLPLWNKSTGRKCNEIRSPSTMEKSEFDEISREIWFLVCSPSLQSLPWELTPNVRLVRRMSAFLNPLTTNSLMEFQICRVKARILTPTVELSPWWKSMGYNSSLSLVSKKMRFSKKIFSVKKSHGIQIDGQHTVVFLVSFLELNSSLSWIQSHSNYIWIFAPPTALPLLADMMLRYLPSHHPKKVLFGKKYHLPNNIHTTHECICHVVDIFQRAHEVPVVIYYR